MRINSLELKNIRSYEEENIVFPEGSVLLSGDIGHGKSTLLLAIEFALFGIQRGELTGDELLREGKSKGSVQLNFTIDGTNYIVMRSLKRIRDNVNQDSGYLIAGELKEELQPGEIKARILEVLGYPKELVTSQKSYIYRYTVYTPQDEMKDIILADEENRLETLRKVFGINKYKIVRNNISIVGSELRGYKRQLTGMVEGIEEKIQEQKSLEIEINKLNKKFEDAKKNRGNIEKELNDGKVKLKSIRDDLRSFNQIKNNRTETQTQKESEEKRLKRHRESIEKLKEKIKKLKDLKQPTEITEEELEKKINESGKNKENYLKNKKGISNEIDKLIKKVEEGTKQSEKFDEEINLSKGVITQLKKSIDELERAGSTCPVCGSNLTKMHREQEVKKNNIKIEDENKKIKSIKDKKMELEKNIEKWADTIDEEADKVIDKLSGELEKLNKLIKELREYNQNIKRMKESEEEVNVKEREDEEIVKTIQQLEKDLGKIDKTLKGYGNIEEKEKKLSENVETIQKKFNESDRIYTGTETEIKNKIEYICKVKEEIKKKENAKKLAEKISKNDIWLNEYLSNLASTIERHFMLHLQKKFNSVFGDWFNQLIDDENLTIRVNNQFTPVIEREGYETLYRHLSGGEKTSVALAYRLALNTVINSLVEEIKTKDIIILDEPTDGFSTNQLDKVRDVINELGVKQTILVSHELKMEGYVEKIINIYKENGISHVRY